MISFEQPGVHVMVLQSFASSSQPLTHLTLSLISLFSHVMLYPSLQPGVQELEGGFVFSSPDDPLSAHENARNERRIAERKGSFFIVGIPLLLLKSFMRTMARKSFWSIDKKKGIVS